MDHWLAGWIDWNIVLDKRDGHEPRRIASDSGHRACTHGLK
jgi:hypothetical protein